MSVKSVVSNIFAKITRFDPDLLEWIEKQEKESRTEVDRIRRQNAIEADILSRKQTQGQRP